MLHLPTRKKQTNDVPHIPISMCSRFRFCYHITARLDHFVNDNHLLLCCKRYMLTIILHNYLENNETNRFQNKCDSDLRTLITFVVDAASNYKYDGTIDGWDMWWTFPKSLLFTITIMTTVGMH